MTFMKWLLIHPISPDYVNFPSKEQCCNYQETAYWVKMIENVVHVEGLIINVQEIKVHVIICCAYERLWFIK